MRHIVSFALLATICLPVMAVAQQSLPTDPPPNPHQVVPDQQLENVDQRLLVAGEQLREAAEAGNANRTEEALGVGQRTVAEVRNVFDGLPQEQRAAYEEALNKAQQVLNQGDPRAGAEAMKTLQETIRTLVQRGR